ncbi:MAG: integrin alpha [Chitinophagaceae bacterium]
MTTILIYSFVEDSDYSMKKTVLFHLFILLFLLLCLLSYSQQNEQCDKWYVDATAHLKGIEYDFYPSTQDQQLFKAANPNNKISINTGPDYYTITGYSSAQKKWNARFYIKGIGRGKFITTVSKNPLVTKTNSRLAYSSGSVTTEYINNPQGLRQNFIINKKPTGNSYLEIVIKITSDLNTKFRNNQLLFVQQDESAKTELVYKDLKVWDAQKQRLNAFMRYNAAKLELSIFVDDANAVYPVTVDPVNQSPQWVTSADNIITAVAPSVLNSTLYGFSVTSLGDVNGDGYSDAAISAPALANIFSGDGSLAQVGAVFVYYGSSSGLHTVPDNVLQPTTAIAGALFGFSIAGGDVAGDTKNDIIIGAPLDESTIHVKSALTGGGVSGTDPVYEDLPGVIGKVYVYKGEELAAFNPGTFTEIKPAGEFYSPGIAGVSSNNTDNKSLFGFSLASVDDLNYDGKNDLAIGAPTYKGIGLTDAQEGTAFVYYSGHFTTPVQLEAPSPSLLGLAAAPSVNSSALLFGYSIDGAGDYNSDGYADVVVGAPAGVDLSSMGSEFAGKYLGGSAYVYYGNGTGIHSLAGARLQATNGSLVNNAANLLGYKVLGLKNEDGSRNGNIIAGAPTGGSIPAASGFIIKTGTVNLFQQQSSSPSDVMTPDEVLESPRSLNVLQQLNTLNLNAMFGSSIDNLYDINCDTYPDLVVGEPLSSSSEIGQLQANPIGGAVYTYYGMADKTFNPTPVMILSGTYGGDMLSVNTAGLFGHSVAGIPGIEGPDSKPKLFTGTPGGNIDYGPGVLNVGSTISNLLSYDATDNGAGKAYGFDASLCGLQAVLPLQIVNLSGQQEETSVNLQWRTTDESNTAGYTIEKSNDGISFITMAYNSAKGGNNDNRYFITDHHPSAINYYRVKVIYKNNNVAYSTTISIYYTETWQTSLIIAPNPVISSYKIVLHAAKLGPYTVELKNTTGQLCDKKNFIASGYNHTENMQRNKFMQAGIYHLTVYNKNQQLVKSFKILFR